MELSVFEGNFLLFLQDFIRFPILDTFFTFVTHLGDSGIIWIAIGIILLIMPKHRREGVCVLTALLIGFLITNAALKNLIARPRPYTLIEGLSILIPEPADFSFPSGHACSSFAAAVTMLRLSDRRAGIAAVILAFVISFSRLYIGVHFPTDVLAGILIGTVSAFISVKIWARSKT